MGGLAVAMMGAPIRYMPSFSSFLTQSNVIRAAALSALILFAVWPLLGDRFFHAIEKAGAAFARKKWLAIAAVAIVPVLLRLALLPVAGAPHPAVHDEFSYLLAADTFAHGRLTNPPHAMWQFFETFYVLQHPTYISKYPPAQGLFLALGQVLGNPWVGVLLSMALAYAAALWMLQGWLPPGWALLGAVFLMLQFDFLGYWANSYWGGFVALMGGALVMGALPRIMHGYRARDSLVLGIGVGILANSRPYEGFLLCIPVAVALAVWLCGRRSPSWRVSLVRVVAPAGCVLVLVGAWMAYYDWRGTGNALTFPYAVYERTHKPMPLFVWQKTRDVVMENPQFEEYYVYAEPQAIGQRLWNGRWQTIGYDITDTARRVFFVGRVTVVALALGLLWLLRDRRIRLLLIQTFICFAGFCLSVTLLSHYAAPLVPTIFCVAVQAMRHMRRSWIFNRPVGIGLTRVLVMALLVVAGVRMGNKVAMARDPANVPGLRRATVLRQLEKEPGEQLVLVRYSPEHNVHDEWVYNRADIDHSKVVWAREIPGMDVKPLLGYFHSRNVWVVEPDLNPARISKYEQTN
jgi:hypothetical protein